MGYDLVKTVTAWWFGTMEFYNFPYIGNVIIPTDFHIFQRGRYTTNQENILKHLKTTNPTVPSMVFAPDLIQENGRRRHCPGGRKLLGNNQWRYVVSDWMG